MFSLAARSAFVGVSAAVIVMGALGQGYCHDLPATLKSGKATLQLQLTGSGRYGLHIQWGKSADSFLQDAPMAVEVVDAQGAAHWISAPYESATATEGGTACHGQIKSANGTRFEFTDTYRPEGAATGSFILARTVRIAAADPRDTAFSSRFSLNWIAPTTTHDCDFFVPGIWYRDNSHVRPTALASHLDDRYFYFREDRLPLPLAMARDKRSGIALSTSHIGGNPTTFAGEDGLDRLTDERMQFGSLGFENSGKLEASFLFPGTEGERTYTFGGSSQGNRWAYRSHPVRNGFQQSYKLAIRLNQESDFPAAVKETWSAAYQTAAPPLIRADLNKVYTSSMDLLATYCHPYDGVISMPFQTRVPTGEVIDTSSEMGFVGQALPCAALLLDYGLAKNDADAVAHASALVDFWAENSPTPSGVPKQWYDIHPGGTVTWRDYPTPLRVASDGLDGALRAWEVARAHGIDHPNWLAFCRSYGDWLVKVQNSDGSYYSSYKHTDGQSATKATDATDHPIKFLIDLYKATGNTAYRDAALRAGNYCWISVHEAYAYVGGTPDNPNVMDKEAGMMALDAFLALYDATGEKKWLTAAAQAAWFCETWIYCWSIPMPPDDPKQVFPKGRTSYGLSLIATGHSGSDAYMAAAPFLYYRLYLLTGEKNFLDVARLTLHDTKQMMDWDGTLGYKYPGLLSEALSLPPLRGHGVQGWLPWLTVAVAEPLVRLRDTFGQMDIDAIEQMPKLERLRREAEFSKRRGFLISSTKVYDK